jgi:hypothetical protein
MTGTHPLGKVVDCVFSINTGTKYNDAPIARQHALVVGFTRASDTGNRGF